MFSRFVAATGLEPDFAPRHYRIPAASNPVAAALAPLCRHEFGSDGRPFEPVERHWPKDQPTDTPPHVQRTIPFQVGDRTSSAPAMCRTRMTRCRPPPRGRHDRPGFPGWRRDLYDRLHHGPRTPAATAEDDGSRQARCPPMRSQRQPHQGPVSASVVAINTTHHALAPTTPLRDRDGDRRSVSVTSPGFTVA